MINPRFQLLSGKMAVLHFQPVEKFPPVMNLLNYLADQQLSVSYFSIFRGKGYSQYHNKSHRQIRIGIESTNPLIRYTTFFLYNLFSLLALCVLKPRVVLYYDTLSVFPAFAYKKLFKNISVVVHHHEFITEEEIEKASFYFKWLTRIEKTVFKQAVWISQTNNDRLRFFQMTHPFVHKDVLHELPNYPPAAWINLPRQPNTKAKPIRFVYVGALSIENTYLVDFCHWLDRHKGDALLDIYSSNISPDARAFLKSVKNGYVRLFDQINYFELPRIFDSYDVGLVLYKGRSVNEKYCVPNKVMEYYCCGLEVWCSDKLVSATSFQQAHRLNRLRMINFDSLKQEPFSKDIMNDTESRNLNCESVYNGMFQEILATVD